MVNEANSLLVSLLRRWWLILLITMIVVGVVVGSAMWRATTSYRTTTSIAASANPSLPPSEMLRASDLLTNDRTMGTLADVVGSALVINAAMEQAAIDPVMRPEYVVSVTNEPDSSVLRMTVDGPRRTDTQQLTDAMKQGAQSTVPQYYPLYIVSPLDSGASYAERVDLSWTRSLILATVVGLGLGALTALWLDAVLAYRRNTSTSIVAEPTYSPEVETIQDVLRRQ